jgi:hypothetical protein
MKGREILVLPREVTNDISDLSQYGKERAANESFIPTFFTSRLKREKCRPAPTKQWPPPLKKLKHTRLRNYFRCTFRVTDHTSATPDLRYLKQFSIRHYVYLNRGSNALSLKPGSARQICVTGSPLAMFTLGELRSQPVGDTPPRLRHFLMSLF